MYQQLTKLISVSFSTVVFMMSIYMWIPEAVFASIYGSSSDIPLQGSRVIEKSIDYSELAERPIFQKSRRFKALADDSADSEKSLIPENPQVKGVAISDPGGKFAFIQSSEDGLVYQLRVGQVMNEKWTVKEINFTQVMLIDELGNEITLETSF